MQKKKSPIKLLLKWAGREKYWIYLSIFLSLISGICTMIPYYGIYRLMDAVYNNTCTSEFVMQDAALIIGAIIVRFVWCFWCGFTQGCLSCSVQSPLYGGRTHGKSSIGSFK